MYEILKYIYDSMTLLIQSKVNGAVIKVKVNRNEKLPI